MSSTFIVAMMAAAVAAKSPTSSAHSSYPALNTETKMSPEQDPMDEVKVASLDDLIKPNLT
jgi:hypothetical protein